MLKRIKINWNDYTVLEMEEVPCIPETKILYCFSHEMKQYTYVLETEENDYFDLRDFGDNDAAYRFIHHYLQKFYKGDNERLKKLLKRIENIDEYFID